MRVNSIAERREVLVLNSMTAIVKFLWLKAAIPGCKVTDSLPHLFPSLWWLSRGHVEGSGMGDFLVPSLPLHLPALSCVSIPPGQPRPS